MAKRPPKFSVVAGNGGAPPPAMGGNVSDDTRREYLERGRIALAEAEKKRQEWRSANGVYRQILKEAKKVGASQIGWTLAMLRREPDELAAEIAEQNRMLVIARIPVGQQLGMFAGHGETVEEIANPPSVAQVIKETWEKRDAENADEAQAAYLAKHSKLHQEKVAQERAAPPKPKGPDDDEEEPEDDTEETEEEDEDQNAKAGNEVLERSADDMAAFKQGERAFLLGRTVDGCPYSSVTSMHGAWTRGWKTKQAAQKVSA